MEVGCGSCSNLWMIAKEGFQAQGIDFPKEAIKLGNLMLKKWTTNAELKIGSMCTIPYKNDFFNAVVDVFSSYCLCINDYIKFLKEVKRILKIEVNFFSCTPSTNSDAFKNFKHTKKIDEYTLDGIKRETFPYYGN